MTVATDTKQFTSDDLLRLADQGRYELVDGQLVEKPMAKKSNELAWRIGLELGIYLKSRPIARVYNEQGFRCFGQLGDKGRVRKPDVAVVLNERVESDASDAAFFNIRPDIAIEVMSPNDLVEDLQEKLEDHFIAEVPIVWIIHPTTKSIEVRRGRNAIEIRSGEELLTANGVLPGFELKVEELFSTK